MIQIQNINTSKLYIYFTYMYTVHYESTNYRPGPFLDRIFSISFYDYWNVWIFLSSDCKLNKTLLNMG